MRKLLAVAILLAASSAAAQTKPEPAVTFEGHTIGETISAFLKITPVQDGCHNESFGVVHTTRCSNLRARLEAAEGPGTEIITRDPVGLSYDKREVISKNSTLVVFGSDLTHDENSMMYSATFTFNGGRLVEMKIDLNGGFAERVRELDRKLVMPATVKSEVYENGFGAVWTEHTALWLTPRLYVFLRDKNGPTEKGMLLTIESRARWERELAAAHSLSHFPILRQERALW